MSVAVPVYPPKPLTSLVEFPTGLQAGQVYRAPVYLHSSVQNAAGGVRTTELWTYPTVMFEVQAILPNDYLDYLEAFFVGVRGTGGRFLFQDWTRPNPRRQGLGGVADGYNATFKARGDQFDSMSAIYINGVVLYTAGPSTTGFVTLPAPPPSGAFVTADVENEKFRVKFMDMQLGQGGRSMMMMFRYGPFEERQDAPGSEGWQLTYRLIQDKQFT